MFFASQFVAQHFNVFSNYLLNVSTINSGAIGKDEALDISIYSRKQWAGFLGSPLTNNVSINAMCKKPSLNFGLMLQDDRIGSTTTQNFLGAYAYRIRFRKFKLAFGLQAGVQILNSNLNKLVRLQDIDQVVTQNQNKQVSFVTGSGIYAHNEYFFAGISVPYLFNTFSKFDLNSTPLFANAGFILKIKNKDLLKPSVLVRRVNETEITTDINLSYYFKSKIGVGVSYRIKNAVVGLLEIIPTDQLKISYCYDYSITAISSHQNGSHELSLKYLFGKRYNVKNSRALYY